MHACSNSISESDSQKSLYVTEINISKCKTLSSFGNCGYLNMTERIRTSVSLFKGYVPFSFSLSSLSFSFSPFPFPSHHCPSLLSLRLLPQDWTWAIIIPVSLEWDISQQKQFSGPRAAAHMLPFPHHIPPTLQHFYSLKNYSRKTLE